MNRTNRTSQQEHETNVAMNNVTMNASRNKINGIKCRNKNKGTSRMEWNEMRNKCRHREVNTEIQPSQICIT
jgi:nucleosome binding factor SPN SPT16 subunit